MYLARKIPPKSRMAADACTFTTISSAEESVPQPCKRVCCVLFKSSNTDDTTWRDTQIVGLYESIEKLKTLFKNYVLLLIVDKATKDDVAFQKAISTIPKSVKFCLMQFDCPKYQAADGRHIGVFATLIRFAPIIKDSPLASNGTNLLLDVEPWQKYTKRLDVTNKFVETFNASVSRAKRIDIAFITIVGNEFSDVFRKARRKHKHSLPYVRSNAIMSLHPIGNQIMTDFLTDLKRNKHREWVFGRRDGMFDYGVDDIFVNLYLLPHLYVSRVRIAFYERFDLAAPFFYCRQQILEHPKSFQILRNIFGSLIAPSSVEQTLTWIDQVFYYVSHASEKLKGEYAQVAAKFWTEIYLHPDWLPPWYIDVISKFRGKLFGAVVTVVCKGEPDRVFDVDHD